MIQYGNCSNHAMITCASSHHSSHWALGIKHLPHIHKEESHSSTCHAVWLSCSPTSYWTLTSFPIFWYLTSFHSTPLNFSLPTDIFSFPQTDNSPPSSSLFYIFIGMTTLPSMDIFLASFSRHTVPGGLCIHLFMPLLKISSLWTLPQLDSILFGSFMFTKYCQIVTTCCSSWDEVSYASPTLTPAITNLPYMVISRLRVTVHCPNCGHGLIYSVNKLWIYRG